MTDPIHTEPRDSHGRFKHGDVSPSSQRQIRGPGKADDGSVAIASIDANPLGILVGGLALGALVGAILPRSTQEKDLLAPVGKSIGERARAALAAAKETGQAELGQIGLTKTAAQSQVRGLVESLVKVAQNVGSAAVKSASTKG